MQAAQAYEHGGKAQVANQLEERERSVHDRVFLFDDQGRELSGRRVPQWALQLAAGVQPKPAGLWGRLEGDRRAAQAIVAPSGKRYTLVIERPAPPHFFFGPNRTPGLGIFIAILSSGLVCFLLARYLTAPVVRLREATQKLAAGDLTARAGTVGSRRRDEIAELVRDFDGMAERLENLVNAQSRLLTDISHELRSPLARLNVALELARQRSGPEANSALERIDPETNRLNELIQRLLTIARLEAGEESIERLPVHLDQIVQDIAKDAGFEAQSRHCQVEATIVDDCVIIGNASLLHSAIENVVRNAIR